MIRYKVLVHKGLSTLDVLVIGLFLINVFEGDTAVPLDVIIAMDRGRIVERGTHDKLLSNANGLYSFLYRQQALLGDEGSWEGGRKNVFELMSIF